jgi:putative DNA primase/helicase
MTEVKTDTLVGNTAKPVAESVGGDKKAKPMAKPMKSVDSTTFFATDLWCAERFEKQYGSDMIFSSERWHIWDGAYWACEQDIDMRRRFFDLVKDVADAAASHPDPEEVQRLLGLARALQSYSRIESIANVSKSKMHIDEKGLNTDRNLLNLKNGTFNLDTRELQPHNKENYITRIIDVDYNEYRKCPKWNRFLESIFPNAEVREYVQKAVGYSFSGRVDEQVLFFLYGPTGLNGKTTFLETISALAGDYACKTKIESILETGGGSSPNPYLSGLVGKRFVSTNETPTNKMWNISCVKDLTGGDEITTRNLYEKPFTFNPTHKLWIMGNDLPEVGDAGDAFWRRVRIIPFEQKIKKIRPQSIVLQEFKDESQGILNWIIDGYTEYKRVGLGVPLAIENATREYRHAEDALQMFIDDECKLYESFRVEKQVFLSAFNRSLRMDGQKLWTMTKLTRALTKKGIFSGGAGAKFYIGLTIKQKEDNND